MDKKEENKKNYTIKTKSNGDIYDYDPIKGFAIHDKLYETEFAKPSIVNNPSLDETLNTTLDEKINNNPK